MVDTGEDSIRARVEEHELLLLLELLERKASWAKARLVLIDITSPGFKLEKPSEHERFLVENKVMHFRGMGIDYADKLDRFYGEEGYSPSEALALFDFKASGLRCVRVDGVTYLADTKSAYYNVVNASRLTTDAPETFDNVVHLFGNCHAVGCFAEDKFTVASFLQRHLNGRGPGGRGYLVRNNANWISLRESLVQALHPRYAFAAGDVVIILCNNVEEGYQKFLEHDGGRPKNVVFENMSTVFNKYSPRWEMFFDNMHTNQRGYEIMAREIYGLLERLEGGTSVGAEVDPKLAAYIAYLKKNRVPAQNAGGVVMNCNPFTNGHKYLITEALKQCDFLYLFVLDEDKSKFSFDDRFTMIRLGLEDLRDRVKILPTGRFIISSVTFPEYFAKDSVQDVEVDTSYDLGIFASVIAPVLGITRRFVGNEPFCNITRQYNEAMKQSLPQAGIEVVEFPRHKSGDREISASEVRRCLEEGNFTRLRELVPPAVYEYLRD